MLELPATGRPRHAHEAAGLQITRHAVAAWRCQSGATSIEYAMIASLIALCIVAALTSVGTTLNRWYSSLGPALR